MAAASGSASSASGGAAAQHHVNAVEAARISAVLETALERLSFLSSITPDILAHRDEVSAIVGEEVARLIAEQRALEARYEDRVAYRASLKGVGNKLKLKDVQDEIAHLSVKIRESMKHLCRSLKENPEIGDNLARITEEREALALLLEKTLTDLRSGHFKTLVDFVQREHDMRDKLRAVASKEEEVTQEVARLNATLREEEEKHAAEMEAKQKELSTLKEELRKLKVSTTLKLRYARKEAAAKTEGSTRAFTAEEADLIRQIEDTRAKVDIELSVHDQTMEVLKKEQEDFARHAEEWRTRHATELETKETELRSLTTEREKQRVELERLQQRYDKDLAELADQEAEEERKREDEVLAKIEDERRRRAATDIQKILGEMFVVLKASADAAKEAKKAKAKEKAKKK